MGGFVRISGGNGGGGGQPIVTGYQPQILFDRPIAQYMYTDCYYYPKSRADYRAAASKSTWDGFHVEMGENNRLNDDHEGIILPIIGLDPIKSYNISFTLCASENVSTTKNGRTDAVGFSQGLINFKRVTGKRTLNITDTSESGYTNYKKIMFINTTVEDLTNYVPISNVTTSPVEYNLVIKKGCNNMAFLCFSLPYPNNKTESQGYPITYFFNNFVITALDEPTSVSTQPLRLNYMSSTNRAVRGITTITNLPTTNKYEVIKVTMTGKCSHGEIIISTNEVGTIDYLENENNNSSGSSSAILVNPDLEVYQIDHKEDFTVSFIIGETTRVGRTGLEIRAAYYPDMNFNYSDDYVDIYYEVTGSASVSFANTYNEHGDELYTTSTQNPVTSQAVAEQIASDLQVEFKEYIASSQQARFWTAEAFGSVRSRAFSIVREWGVNPVPQNIVFDNGLNGLINDLD